MKIVLIKKFLSFSRNNYILYKIIVVIHAYYTFRQTTMQVRKIRSDQEAVIGKSERICTKNKLYLYIYLSDLGEDMQAEVLIRFIIDFL